MLKFPHYTEYHYFYIQIFVPYAKILKPLPGIQFYPIFFPIKYKILLNPVIIRTI